MTYRILFVGDVVGRPGRHAVRDFVPALKEHFQPLFTIINGENSAGGVGITPDIAEEIYGNGADGITLGNHAFNKRDIFDYLGTGKPIARPANLHPDAPGKGSFVLERDGIGLMVANLCGRVFLEGYDDPFREADRLVEAHPDHHRFFDFHAEATSEKIAFGYHLDGRAVAVVGTHTHVQTADERILAGGTAVITDVGMTGPMDGVLGMEREIIMRRFVTGMPGKFEVSNGPGTLHGVVIEVERSTGRAVSIERVRMGE